MFMSLTLLLHAQLFSLIYAYLSMTTSKICNRHSKSDCVNVHCTTYSLYKHECFSMILLYYTISSDEEYGRRVQMQNEWVVRQVDNMQDYKQSLLFNLAANLDAEVRSIVYILLFLCALLRFLYE